MSSIAVAAPSVLAADAAASVIAAGGGAVDAALAAAIASMVTEPGVVAPGAGAFVTVLPPAGEPLVVDGYMAVPGLGGRNPNPVEHAATMAYGGGVTTIAGPASIAVPGAWEAFGLAHRRFGRLAWADVLSPAIDLARDGTPLGITAATYLAHALGPVFSHDPAGREALAPHGSPVTPGAMVRVPGLAESLTRLAESGADDLYRGSLAGVLADDLWRRGSHLGAEDLRRYRAEERSPLRFRLDDWEFATNPAPAVGGAALAAMVRWASSGDPEDLVAAQRRVYGWRRNGADGAADRTEAVEALLAEGGGDPLRSPSTAHVSAAGGGAACAITLSAGYGSGVIPTGTGMWMNNGLGELELVGDRARLQPGRRLNSNMAPTVGRLPDGTVLAIGSPGADRITSAIAQTLLGMTAGRDPASAVAAPRVHVDVGAVERVAVEPGIDLPPLGLEVVAYDDLHMYFGGVGLAVGRPDGSAIATTDPRRNGAAFVA